MVDDQDGTTSWAFARERLANPAPGQTSWLATVRPDGSPHLVPIIAFWIDDAFHFGCRPAPARADLLCRLDRE